jgi:DNA-binding MarR family transcriptional regulator
MAADGERSFGFLLYDSARLLRRNFDRRARPAGLTRAQWSVLANLARNEGIKQTELADILEIQPITLVGLIDRLEAVGMVERRSHPSDRRARTLHLTHKARPMLEHMRELADETRQEAMAGLSVSEQEHLIDQLNRIRRNLSERDVGAETKARSVHG